MKKFYKLLLWLVSFCGLLAPFSARATHVMGADISWKCAGGDTFEITVKAYRDCNGIPLSGTNLTFFSTSPGTCVSSTSANPSVCCGTDITPTCSNSSDRCKDAGSDFPYGIQVWTITATVVLPPPCCNYTFAWEECCRNGAITTGAAGNDFYTEVYMNRCIKPCVNSPYFSNPPVGIFCVNQCVVYNPAGNDISRDINGQADSLVYSFGSPTSGPGSDISYLSGYSDTTPLIYSGTDPSAAFVPPYCLGFHLDPTNGDIEFKATKTDVTVFVIVVTAYRKDSLGIERPVAETRRDLQIAIIDCPANHPPIITGINGGTTNSVKICADKQTCFTIKAFDLDPPDTDRIQWTDPGTMPGASFTVKKDGKKWPTATFCWSPTDANVRSYPYTFVVTAFDNACPVPGRADRAFSVYVIASPRATYSAIVQNCGVVNFSAGVAANSTTTITSYVWTGQGSPGYGPLYIPGPKGSYKYTRPGTYTYTLTVTGPNGCTRNYEDSVKIPQFDEVFLPPDTTICAGSGAMTITATTAHTKAPYSTWFGAGPLTATNKASSITVKVIKDTAFRANVSDATGCTNYDSMKVHVQALPKPNIGPDRRGCWGHPVMLTDGMKKTMPYAAWTHIKGKDTTYNYLHGDTIFVNDSGIYVVTVKDSFGCPGTASVNVFFNPYLKATSANFNVCDSNSITLKAGIGGSGASYVWRDVVHGRTVGTDSTYFIQYATAPQYSYQVIITQSQHGVTCADTGLQNAYTKPKPHPILGGFPSQCVNNPPLQISASIKPRAVDVAHEGGVWYYPRNPAAVANGYIFPNLIGRTDGKDSSHGYIHYIYKDQYGCTSDDTVYIYISPLPTVSAGPDAILCRANGMYLLSNSYVGPSPGTWTPLTGKNLTRTAPTPKAALVTKGDSLYFDPSKAPLDTVYGVIYSFVSSPSLGTSQCSNSDTVYLTVKTNPTIQFTHIDSQCNNASAVQLTVSPQGGTFTFMDNTAQKALQFDPGTNAYYFYPDSTTGGFHKLLYTAYADESRKLCGTVDSEQIYVVPAPAPDFYTADHSWQYCVSHAPIELKATIAGGSYASSPNPSLVYQSGSKWFFDPSKADTTDSSKNLVSYILPYNSGKCNAVISHEIGVDGRPYVKILSSPTVCDGNKSFQIYATSKNVTKLTWTSDGGNTQFQNINGSRDSVTFFPSGQQLQSFYFNVYLTGANHGVCAISHDKDSFNIFHRPYVSFSSNRQHCEPFNVQFTDTANLPGKDNGVGIKSYDWDFGDGSTHDTFPDPKHTYVVKNGQSTQQYTVKFTATSDQGCTSDTIKQNWITVFASPKPAITANPSITTIALPQIQFDINEPLSRGIDFADPKTTYNWNFGDSSKQYAYIKNPQYTYLDTGKFKVVVQVQSKGCIGDSSLYVYIQPELIIYIPNVFTPGGMHGRGKGSEPNYFSENENNTFQPVISAYSSFEMSVYNRWGELMYSTTDPLKGWDGRYEGRRPLQDVYVYVIKATSYSGKPYTFTGTVTLLY